MTLVKENVLLFDRLNTQENDTIGETYYMVNVLKSTVKTNVLCVTPSSMFCRPPALEVYKCKLTEQYFLVYLHQMSYHFCFAGKTVAEKRVI